MAHDPVAVGGGLGPVELRALALRTRAGPRPGPRAGAAGSSRGCTPSRGTRRPRARARRAPPRARVDQLVGHHLAAGSGSDDHRVEALAHGPPVARRPPRARPGGGRARACSAAPGAPPAARGREHERVAGGHLRQPPRAAGVVGQLEVGEALARRRDGPGAFGGQPACLHGTVLPSGGIGCSFSIRAKCTTLWAIQLAVFFV